MSVFCAQKRVTFSTFFSGINCQSKRLFNVGILPVHVVIDNF